MRLNQEISIPYDKTATFDPFIRPLIHLFFQIQEEKVCLSYERFKSELTLFSQIPEAKDYLSSHDYNQLSHWIAERKDTLDLSSLQKLPLQIKQCQKLRSVRLSSSHLKSFLPNLAKLPLIKVEIVIDPAKEETWQSDLENELTNFPKLKVIHIFSNNQLTQIFYPSDIQTLAIKS